MRERKKGDEMLHKVHSRYQTKNNPNKKNTVLCSRVNSGSALRTQVMFGTLTPTIAHL